MTAWDGLMFGFYTLLVSPKRLRKMRDEGKTQVAQV